MADIFLSYNREDQAKARLFAEGFERFGFSVWWDVTLRSGEAYDKVTEDALRHAKAVVVLWSKKSVESRWVRAEATLANRNGTLVPVMIESCERPIMFELTQTADLCHWRGDIHDQAWQSFLSDVQRFVKIPSAASLYTGPIESAHANQAPGFPRRPSLWLIAGAVLVAGLATVMWLYIGPSGEQPTTNIETPGTAALTSGTEPAPEAATSNPRTAVAVMAFANLTGDASKDYLGDGMSEELIQTLGKVPGLTVPSRTSTFAYKGRDTSLKQIASDLGVGTVLEGSVRAAGSTIRISATLIDAQTDRQLWSENYDREFADLFKLQDDLARAIVQALQGQLSPAAEATLANAQPTQNLEAYSLFLQASLNTGAGFAGGIEMFDQAIALDPGFAKAYAYKAGAYTTAVLLGITPPATLEAAEETALQALALDPSLSEAQAALGIVEAFKGNWLAAEQRFSKVEPTRTGFDASYGTMVLESGGYLKKADAWLQKTYLSAPAFGLLAMQLATNFSVMGNDVDAQRYINLALDLGVDPNAVPVPQIQANAAYRSGNPELAAEHLIRGMLQPLRDAGGEAVIRQVYAALAEPDKRPAAIRELKDFIDSLGSGNLDPIARKDFIASFTMLGALDEAFALTNAVLDDYAQSGVVGYAWGVLWLPEMKAFRQDPRFQDIARRLKLFDYWQQYGPPDGCALQQGNVVCQ